MLIRHGETGSNVDHLLDTDFPGAGLNENGFAQAAALAEVLADQPIQAIFSSDLTRAAQTAAALAGGLAVPHQTLRHLREIRAGDDEMSPDLRRYVATLATWFSEEPLALPNGDSRESFLTRYDDGIATAAAAGDCVAVVSHGAAMRVWLGHRADNVGSELAARLRLVNTAVVVLDGGPGAGWRVLTWDGVAPGPEAGADALK